MFRAIAVANTSRDSSSPEGYSGGKSYRKPFQNCPNEKGFLEFFPLSDISSFCEYSSCPIFQGRARLFKPQTRLLMAFDGYFP